MWNKKITVSNKKSIDTLEINYIPYEKSLIDMGYSLIEKGYVPNRIKK